MSGKLNKICNNMKTALSGVLYDGMTIMIGGFGLCGIPEHAIEHIDSSSVKNLTIISNNCGVDGFGIGRLVQSGKVSKLILSYLGGNKLVEEKYINGSLEIEFNPQGTLAERIRAGGSGIPGFYTKTGIGTIIAEGKEVKIFDGKAYLLETALYADLAIVKAWKSDSMGNLLYRKTARNFNALMVTAANLVVAEVEEIVGIGEIGADYIHTPGIFVDKVLQFDNFDKRIEVVMLNQGR